MSRVSVVLAGAFVAALHLAALGAGFLSPYGFEEQSRGHAFAPPTRLRFVDARGDFHPRPFVCLWTADRSGGYREDCRRAFPVRFLVPGPRSGGAGPGLRLFGVDPPARLFLLGTDRFGRDQLSRLLHGARVSLFAGLLAALLAVGAGLLAGAAAGYFGGWLDGVLMRGSELFLTLPWLYLLLGVRAFLPLDLPPAWSFLMVVAVLGAVGWAQPARLVRGAVSSARHRDYVLAARGFGASDLYLLRVHVLPQALGVALTQLVMLVPQYVLAEVLLSFLGLGVVEPAPSWGTLIAELESYVVLVSYGWMLAPAALLTLLVLSYHLIAEAVRNRIQVGDI